MGAGDASKFIRWWHGRQFLDQYKWIEKRSSRLTRLIRSENRRYNDFTKPSSSFLPTFANFRRAVVDCNLVDKLTANNRYNYFLDQHSSALCRRDIHSKREQVVFDSDQLSKTVPDWGGDIHELIISDDDQFIAALIPIQDDVDRCMVLVKRADSAMLLEPLRGIVSIVWIGNSLLLCTMADEKLRPDRVVLYNVENGTRQTIFQEHDETFLVNIARTKDGSHAVITSASKSATEAWLICLSVPDYIPYCVRPRQHNIDYFVEHVNGFIYLITNFDRVDYKLLRYPVGSPDLWEDIYVPDVGVIIKDADYFNDRVVLYVRDNGSDRVLVIDIDGSKCVSVALNHNVPGTLRPGINKIPSAQSFRFSFESTFIPEITYEYNWRSDELHELSRQSALEKLSSDYVSNRVEAQSNDGTKIPITLTYRRDLSMNHHSVPVIAVVYGAYGQCLHPEYDISNMAMIRHGFAIAHCHVRGGGEYGKKWHEQGRLHQKCNTFSDYIACIEHLIESGITRPELLCSWGASAGGLCVASVLNSRADLFRTAVLDHPFVDVLTPTMDSSLPLSIQDHQEWGDPNILRDFDNILSYSPYQNVSRQAYPDIMVTTSLMDNRVPYWIPIKYLQRVRAHQTRKDAISIMKVCYDAGHFGYTAPQPQDQHSARKLYFISLSMRL